MRSDCRNRQSNSREAGRETGDPEHDYPAWCTTTLRRRIDSSQVKDLPSTSYARIGEVLLLEATG